MDKGLKVSIIYGSVRSQRKGIVVAKYLKQQLENRNITVYFIDPLQYSLPFLDKMYKEYDEDDKPETMHKISDMLTDSDGFLIVSGEYNHGTPPVLKNLLDHFQREYYFKPSAIASYSVGQFGGVRNAIHLRAVLAELGTPSIPSILAFPYITKLFNAEGNSTDSNLDKRLNRFLDEFIWYMDALKTQRKSNIPY